MKQTRHDFFELMDAVRNSLAEDYLRIRARVSVDPGTAGDQVEESWAELLRNWLPAEFPVVTKGRILFADGSSSPQVDILVLLPTYPRGLRKQKYIFAGGVVAAFECKLTVRGEHIRDAFQTSALIKQKAKRSQATPYDELNASPIFGLLAHSHAFRGAVRSWSLHTAVERYQDRFAEHPRELIDVICVADAATIPVGKTVLFGKDLSSREKRELAELKMPHAVSTMYVINDERALGAEVDSRGQILASLVHDLTYRIASRYPHTREWNDHLGELGFYGGIGRPIFWKVGVLSNAVRQRLSQVGRDEDRWSKWCRYLP